MKEYSLMPQGIQSKLLEQPHSSSSGWLHMKLITDSVWLLKTCCLGSNPTRSIMHLNLYRIHYSTIALWL